MTSSAAAGTNAPSVAVLNSDTRGTVGGTASLSVAASGDGAFNYQWRLNGVPITSATSATLNLTNLSSADAGAYSVVVSNSHGSETVDVGDLMVMATDETLNGMASGSGIHVAVGDNGTIVYSTDMLSWATATPGVLYDLNSISFGDGVFVAVGHGGAVLTSADGTTWTVQNLGISDALNDVVFGGGAFVAVGENSRVIYSLDAVNWYGSSGAVGTLNSVAYGNNTFVAVGDVGVIWSTSNLVTWDFRGGQTFEDLNDATYGGGLFVTVGKEGVIMSSLNGVQWTSASSGTTEPFEAVTYENGGYYAIGPAGRSFQSSDGQNWLPANLGSFGEFESFADGGGTVSVIGKHGAMVPLPFPVLSHFSWEPISSPQIAGVPITVTLKARDAAGQVLTDFTGIAEVHAEKESTPETHNALGLPQEYSFSAEIEERAYGYAFSPTADVSVTHLSHYAGKTISLWKDDGTLLASVERNPNIGQSSWVETPLAAPVGLKAGEGYRISYYFPDYQTLGYFGKTTFNNGIGSTFPHGSIDQAFAGPPFHPDSKMPVAPIENHWPQVDFRYTVVPSVSTTVTPVTTGSFSNGVWMGQVTLNDTDSLITLTAKGPEGQTGASEEIMTLMLNDVSLSVDAAPAPIGIGTNLTYTITVLNAGPTDATSVTVICNLPAEADFVSSSSSQGSTSESNGILTANLGTVSTGTANLTIVVTPSVAGITLTNSMSITRGEADADGANNSLVHSISVPSELFISGETITEANVGLTNMLFTVNLVPESSETVAVNYLTGGGSAIAWEDYVPTAGTLIFQPGETNKSVTVQIYGDVEIESDETVQVTLTTPVNASLGNVATNGIVANDDGIPGNIHYFELAQIASPQRVGEAISTTITAKDVNGTTVSTFNGPANLSALKSSLPPTDSILGPLTHQFSYPSASYITLGHSFTPSTDIIVTHVRHYSGTKVSIWGTNEVGNAILLVSQEVSSTPGSWTETPLSAPLELPGGETYWISYYTEDEGFYWRTDGIDEFRHGSIGQAYYSAGDAFPTTALAPKWYFVDLLYAPGSLSSASVSPASTGSFTNGVWAGSITPLVNGEITVIQADDGDGHVGAGNAFSVHVANDLQVTLMDSPFPADVGMNLIYTATIMNPGPNASTGVMLTNLIPSDVTFVSATSTQGTCTHTNGEVVCSLGTINSESSATVTVTVVPLIAGVALANSVEVARNESDPDLSNNSATLMTPVKTALATQLADALEMPLFGWRAGGNALWFSQNQESHDGIDASQSGAIGDDQWSFIEVTVNGPGTISFWWKVSSEANKDFLRFFIDGNSQDQISGEAGWTLESFAVPAGTHILKWEYRKDQGGYAGDDAGWLDEVAYSVPSFDFTTLTILTGGEFDLTLDGTADQILTIEASTNLIDWLSIGTVSFTSGSTNFTDTSSTNFPYRFYRATFQP